MNHSNSAFNIINFSGNNIEEFFTGFLDINSVTFVTENYSCDIEAIHIADELAESIMNTGIEEFDQTKKFNPDFFPSMVNEDFNKLKQEELLKFNDHITDLAESHAKSNKIAIPITHAFDVLGDYVLYKIELTRKDLTITIKSAMNPNSYVNEKTKQVLGSIEDSTISSLH